MADSFEKAIVASGVGIPAFCSRMCVKSLIPARSPVFRQLTTLAPRPSRVAVE